MHVNYEIPHDVNILAVIIKALVLWGVTDTKHH